MADDGVIVADQFLNKIVITVSRLLPQLQLVFCADIFNTMKQHTMNIDIHFFITGCKLGCADKIRRCLN